MLNEDPAGGVFSDGGDTGVLIEDAQSHYVRYEMTPAAAEELINDLDSEIRNAEEWMAPEYRRRQANLEAYEAEGRSEDTLTLPLAKQHANQIISWIVNTVCNKDPIITVRPDHPAEFTVMKAVGAEGNFLPEKITADEAAERIERIAEHKFKKKLSFRLFFEELVTDAVIGAAPAWAKVVYSPQEMNVRQPDYAETDIPGVYRLGGYTDQSVLDGEPTTFYSVSTFDILYPHGTTNIQKCPWMAELLWLDPLEMRQKFLVDYAAVPEEEREELLKSTTEYTHPSIKGSPSRPTRKHRIYETWVSWPARVGGTERILSLCVHYHPATRKLLMSYVNPYAHGYRPYVPFVQRRKPRTVEGWSTVGDVAPFQRFNTRMFTLEARNAAQSALKAFLVRRGSTAAKYLDKFPEIKPGQKIFYDAPGEIEPFQLGGTQGFSLLPLIEWADNQAAKVSAQSDFAAGRELKGRTPAETFRQALDQALTQPASFLESMRESLALLFRLYFQTLQQYSQEGIVLPVTADEADNQLVQQIMHLPVEAIRDQFNFSITATPDDETKGQEFERMMALQKFVVEDNASLDKMLQALLSPAVFGPYEMALFKMVSRQERVLGRMFEIGRTDKDSFIITDAELRQMLEMKQQLLMQQMQATQMLAMGQMPDLSQMPPALAMQIQQQMTQQDNEMTQGGEGAPTPM